MGDIERHSQRFCVPAKVMKRGDTVAIVAPSSGLAAVFPHVRDRGIAAIHREFGLRTKLFP